jgi:hypothetical protein
MKTAFLITGLLLLLIANLLMVYSHRSASSEGFTNYWIIVEDYSNTVGKLNIDELETYLNLQKSLANPSYKNYYRRPKKSLELNFRK